MENNCGIYKITNLLEPKKVYIGQSVNLKKRYSDHFPPRKEEDSYIHRTMNAYSPDNFSWEVLEYLPNELDILNEREKYWIKQYHSYYKDPEYLGGYNLTEGGQPQAEHLKRPVIQYSLTGEFIAEYPSLKEAENASNIHHSAISAACQNKRQRGGQYLWKYKEDTIDNNAIEPLESYRHNNIRVFKFNEKGILIDIYNNLEDASNKTQISKQTICKACKDKKVHKQAIWRYENEIEIPLKIEYGWSNSGPKRTPVCQYDKDTKELIGTYESVKKASQITGVNSSNIASVCQGRRKTAGGYVWSYT